MIPALTAFQRLLIRAALILGAGACPGAAQPADTALLCDAAAARAAAEAKVPLDVLRAIARTETGRTRDGALAPWPWAVNMEGEGHWFATRAEAEAHVARHRAAGARSFDIGCFQINHLWHGAAFASVSEMFDPDTGARYAAGFLARLHDELGDWSVAAGAYHSRTPARATAYRDRFDRIRAALDDAPPVLRTAAAPARPNAFPLLQAGDGQTIGSLVPLSGAAGRGLFGMN